MANPDHLEILEQGVESWNAWQYENVLNRPDLKGANLRGLNLTAADLTAADLTDAGRRATTARRSHG